MTAARRVAHWWNWKAALVSAVSRSLIFLVANLPAGIDAALGAMCVEFAFRAGAAGFFGAMTQAFAALRRPRLATVGALAVVPAVAHAAEFLVHSAAGTPQLAASIAGSLAFSLLTTAFNLHAMRHGALIVGAGSRPLSEDLRRAPALAGSLVLAAIALVRGSVR